MKQREWNDVEIVGEQVTQSASALRWAAQEAVCHSAGIFPKGVTKRAVKLCRLREDEE